MVVLTFREGIVEFLDQTKLPAEEVRIATADYRDIVSALKRLAIRGAPLIGIAAAYGVVLAARSSSHNTHSDFILEVRTAIDILRASRPTAVNLGWALDRQRSILERSDHLTANEITAGLTAEAIRIHREDEAMCERIAEYGAEILPNAASVLTHCNTGSLATGGRGTALGIISKAWERMKLRRVYVDETRPLLQGSRLTAWELQKLGIPFELLPDNASGFLMQQGLVSCVVVGADRIAANGDVANKIGTYNLAVLAHHHNIPFFVAAPYSTIDLTVETGTHIPIEQRSAEELTDWQGHPIAPAETRVYNPAFDITPAALISAIVTDRGVARPPFPLATFVQRTEEAIA